MSRNVYTGFKEVGGYSSLIDKYFLAIPSANATIQNASGCAGVPSVYAMNLLRPVTADLPWTALTFGLIGNALWYWCCDQVLQLVDIDSISLLQVERMCLIIH